MYNKRSGAEIITVIIWIPGGDEISAYGTVYETIKINLRRRIVRDNQIRRCYDIPSCINKIEEFSMLDHFLNLFFISFSRWRHALKNYPSKAWNDEMTNSWDVLNSFFVSSIYNIFSRTTGKNHVNLEMSPNHVYELLMKLKWCYNISWKWTWIMLIIKI